MYQLKTGAVSSVEGDDISEVRVRGVAISLSLVCGVIGNLGEFTLSREKPFLFCFECRVEGTFLHHARCQSWVCNTAILMESAATFARAENIRVAVHDLGFVCLELMEGFFTFNHANFALHGTRRLHASNSIPLPENRRFHGLFELPTGVIAIGGIIIMLGKWDGKSVSLGVASRSTPVRTKVFSTRLDDLPHISYCWLVLFFKWHCILPT